jgi:hypothetical protein
VALHDGTIKRSTDGGASWSVHGTPAGRVRAPGVAEEDALPTDRSGSQGVPDEPVKRNHEALRDVPGAAAAK